MATTIIVGPRCAELLNYVHSHSPIIKYRDSYSYYTLNDNGHSVIVWDDFIPEQNKTESSLLSLKGLIEDMNNIYLISFIPNGILMCYGQQIRRSFLRPLFTDRVILLDQEKIDLDKLLHEKFLIEKTRNLYLNSCIIS